MKAIPENMKSSPTMPTNLTDDSQWHGAWHQPIVFPNGDKNLSTKDKYFWERESLGKKKWEILIKPNLPRGESFMDIGCNAGLHLVLADNFKELYGVERNDFFYKQCLYVLRRFGKKATIIKGDALDVELPTVDVALMANALYWVGYSDNEEFADNYEERVDDFLKRLSEKTKWVLLIGAENIDRIGGSLDKTIPYVEKYFNIIKAEKITLDRPLNIILCKTKSLTK